VPRFEHSIGSPDLRLGPQVVLREAVRRDGADAAERRIEQLSAGDLAFQVSLIRGTIRARGFRMIQGAPAAGVAPVGSPRRSSRPSVEALAEEIEESAICEADGTPTWLVLTPFGDGMRMHFGLAPPGLYDGRAGIAAFLHVAGADDFARATLAPVSEVLAVADDETRSRYLRDIGMGLTGAGGLLRLFLFIARLKPGEAEWARDAASIVSALSPTTVERERELDLVGGLAGLARPLAASARRRGGRAEQELLLAIGKRLAEGQDPVTGGWYGGAAAPLTGWAHGASGLAVALAESSQVIGDPDLDRALVRGLDYEASTFERSRGWPDLRGGIGPAAGPAMNVWCHGSAGIALARQRLLDLRPSDPRCDRWQAELEAAVGFAVQAPPLELDHLCCGNLGRAAIVGYLGRRQGREHWVDAASAIEVRAFDRMAAAGTFRTVSATGHGGPPAPGLMTGLAGIGMYLSAGANDEWIEDLLF
jgi:lantibiotic modifying enzyme